MTNDEQEIRLAAARGSHAMMVALLKMKAAGETTLREHGQ